MHRDTALAPSHATHSDADFVDELTEFFDQFPATDMSTFIDHDSTGETITLSHSHIVTHTTTDALSFTDSTRSFGRRSRLQSAHAHSCRVEHLCSHRYISSPFALHCAPHATRDHLPCRGCPRTVLHATPALIRPMREGDTLPLSLLCDSFGYPPEPICSHCISPCTSTTTTT